MDAERDPHSWHAMPGDRKAGFYVGNPISIADTVHDIHDIVQDRTSLAPARLGGQSVRRGNP